jgi:peptidoglycan/xylan/chitin deacetylase (PgdA/CDA1 family)
MSVLHGDAASEQFLSEISGAAAFPARHMSMESIYEYGSRAGVWRILREFERRRLPLTVFGVAMALERNPEVAARDRRAGPRDRLPRLAVDPLSEHRRGDRARAHADRRREPAPGQRARLRSGWYTGRDSPNTRRLVVEHGGFLYDSDYYGDDLPFWTAVTTADGRTHPHLIVPYTLDANDMRFASAAGFANGTEFFEYLRDAFDVLYAEGAERPKMMSIGMHCRLLGRPGRLASLQRFLDHVARHDRVWICRRADIARHWIERHPYAAPGTP